MKWILKNSEDDMITLKQNDDLFNLKRCCAKYLALAPIFECLNVNNIPYANIKGETLSLVWRLTNMVNVHMVILIF